ncbi:PGP1 isoform X1 [Iris pallida]|uniref:PGP1 isoform X1 n=1 Tax=Iris pallida TaxID=29817 RepID=A0AAX6FNX3_IRIPA|nr:PGP1 isoform X1 [Iris pallida]
MLPNMKKRKGSKFFDLEAQVDNDEEEEDEDDGEDGNQQERERWRIAQQQERTVEDDRLPPHLQSPRPFLLQGPPCHRSHHRTTIHHHHL